jgi:diaminohydroxyphosphoribosylaminopyrimidine deaminase/5-amino-6-(5-phosphoribosylamino)uracil reductase
MSYSADDKSYMALALALAEKGRYSTQPNPMVGCVLVKGGEIIGEGWHQKAGEAHAEINALVQASQSAEGSTAYVTLEPCCHTGKTPPCVNALIEAGVSRVVIAQQDPNVLVGGKGISALESAGIKVSVGLMGAQAEEQNKGFLQRMRTGRPRVFSKVAMSLDGRTALASGESQWITGEAAREDVHRLRAQSGAVITGVGTVLADDPQLTVRKGITPLPERQPLRVVLDSTLQTPAGARLSKGAERCVLLTCRDDAEKIAELTQAGFRVQTLPADESGKLNLLAVLDWLATQEINDVMLEAGNKLNGAFLNAGLMDEIIVYLAPSILGDTARGAFNVPALQNLADKVELECVDVTHVGDDLKLRYRVLKAK